MSHALLAKNKGKFMRFSILNIMMFFAIAASVNAMSSPKKIKMLETIPEDRSLSYGEVVYVENDGRCEKGLIIKVTGGKKSKDIRRKYECIERPEK